MTCEFGQLLFSLKQKQISFWIIVKGLDWLWHLGGLGLGFVWFDLLFGVWIRFGIWVDWHLGFMWFGLGFGAFIGFGVWGDLD